MAVNPKKVMPTIVREAAPKVGVDWTQQEGTIMCDLCKKFYAEVFDKDDQMNMCIWCNIEWHAPIGKMNHHRFPVDGRANVIKHALKPEQPAAAE
mmetsp:Transcript_28513/g.56043  ORF Transcript_28513/g.56043 Transcript_28513/m.56043 type:complete len:95 (-) Transcript_28513:328-612(-)